jgi:hypothetical protein
MINVQKIHTLFDCWILLGVITLIQQDDKSGGKSKNGGILCSNLI